MVTLMLGREDNNGMVFWRINYLFSDFFVG
jgi:hypothetical protein